MMTFLQHVIFCTSAKIYCNNFEHLATTTNDNAQMPFWLLVVTIHTVYPGLAFFGSLIRTL
jgi:hypothetical protein